MTLILFSMQKVGRLGFTPTLMQSASVLRQGLVKR